MLCEVSDNCVVFNVLKDFIMYVIYLSGMVGMQGSIYHLVVKKW